MPALVMLKFKVPNYVAVGFFAVGLAGCATKEPQPAPATTETFATDLPAPIVEPPLITSVLATNDVVPTGPFLQAFQAHGVIQELPADGQTIVLSHEEIPGYLAAATTTFAVKDTNELAGFQPSNSVSFQLMVAATNSWVEQLKKLEAR